MLRRLFYLLVIVGAVGGAGYEGWRLFQVDPPLAQAERLMASGQVFKAQVVLHQLLRAEPRNANAHLALARSHLLTGDWVSAEKEARALRTLGYDRAVASPILVRAYAMQKRFQEILTDIPAVAARPEEQALNSALRSTGFLGLQDMAEAQDSVDVAAKLAPDDFLVRLSSGRVALAKGDATTARVDVDVALGRRPDSVEALWAKADVLTAMGDLAGAAAALDRAVALAPLLRELRIARLPVLIGLQRNTEAQQEIDVLLKGTGDSSAAQFYSGVLAMRAGQLAEANAAFDRLGLSLERYPKAYLYKAQIALRLDSPQSALEDLEHYLRLVPADAEGARLLARVYMDSKRPERALETLRGLTGAGTGDAGAIDLQGRAYFMLGRMPEAVESFRRAAGLAPGNKEYAAHLAAAQVQFGAAPVPEEAQ